MPLINNGPLSQVSRKVLSGHNILTVWLFLWLALSLGSASTANCGIVDQLTKKDPAALEERCRKGEMSLCISIGNMYRHGVDVTKDVDKAIEFYGLFHG